MPSCLRPPPPALPAARRAGPLLLVLAACGSSASASPPDAASEAAPDVSPDASTPAEASAPDSASPVWPAEWSADIQWSDFGADGAKTNTWTGHVSYKWHLRAMRTDVTPPPGGGMPGPPIGVAGSMLMRDGRIYYVPAAGACTLQADFGAPRPDWLSASGAQGAALGSTSDEARLSVDLGRLDGGLAGCFSYLFRRVDDEPLRFGGSSSCQDWPKGSYVEYSNFATGNLPDSLFAVPAACPPDGGTPEGSVGCHACHDAP